MLVVMTFWSILRPTVCYASHTGFEVSWRHTQAQYRNQRETHQSPYLLTGRELRGRNDRVNLWLRPHTSRHVKFVDSDMRGAEGWAAMSDWQQRRVFDILWMSLFSVLHCRRSVGGGLMLQWWDNMKDWPAADGWSVLTYLTLRHEYCASNIFCAKVVHCIVLWK